MRLAQERRRDNHQWILDWVIKETGMVQNFERERRSVPSSVKSYAMIPKIMGKVASHHEEIALKVEEAGHYQTARELYLSAVQHYHTAQRSIFQDGNKLKIAAAVDRGPGHKPAGPPVDPSFVRQARCPRDHQAPSKRRD